MKPPLLMNAVIRSVFPMLCSVIGVIVVTFLTSLAKPDCTDPAMKSSIVGGILFGQWLFFCFLIDVPAPEHGIALSLIFALIGLPIMAVTWIVSLWPIHYFGFSRVIFRAMIPWSYLPVIPVTLAGSVIAELK